jgi:hypothetical protein
VNDPGRLTHRAATSPGRHRSSGLTLPVYKRLSLAVSTLDTFLNNPPPGFKKNSFQFTTGLTYTLP